MALFLTLLVTMLAVTSSWGQTTTPTPPPHTHKTHAPKPTPVYDDVLTQLKNMTQFNTLLDLISVAGLESAINSMPELTFFAPTDDAFAKLPAGTLDSLKNDPATLAEILKYHVSSQSIRVRRTRDKTIPTLNNNLPLRINIYGTVHTVTAEGVNITKPDIHIKNGFLNILDGVLSTPSGNVMDIISSRQDLTLLNSLLQKSGLDAIIRADQNITIFAPTNAAFGKVDNEVLAYLQNNPSKLTETLLYHVVARFTLYSLGMSHALTFPSADHHHDRLMTLEDSSGEIYVNQAMVVERDLSATNGVLHTIDDVLVPSKILVGIHDNGLNIVG